MAEFGVEISGIKEIMDALENFEGDLDQAALTAIDKGLSIVENQAKTNLSAMLFMDYSNGNILFNSISHTAVIGKDGNPAGDVGIYDMPNKTGDGGKKRVISGRRITAPLVAFFHQEGVQPHSLAKGSRTARRPTASNPYGAPAKGQEQGVQHPGFIASPFLHNAWSTHASTVTDIIIRNLEKVGD